MKKLLLTLFLVLFVALPVMAEHIEIHEAGIQEIVDKDDKIDAQDYSATVDFDLSYTTSGKITQFALIANELAGGAILSTQGDIYIFDADPDTTAGDTALAAAGAEHKTLIAIVPVATADWDADANGGIATIDDLAIYFHNVKTLYIVFRPISAETSINSDSGDDEELFINFWYERYYR